MAAISWKSGTSGDWSVAADWSGGAVPGAKDDVTFGVAGTYTVTISTAEAANSLVLNSSGATVADDSTLTIGSTLTLTAGLFELQNAGTISGGVLSASGGAFQWAGGTLDGVTYDGTLDMSAANSILRIGPNGVIAKGAGGSGNGTITLTGASSQLQAINNQTLNNVTLSIGSDSGGYAAFYDDDTTSTNHTLTLGSGLTINQVGTGALMGDEVGYAGDGFVNNGAINASVSGGAFIINPNSFVNNGTIKVSNGDTLTMSATTLSGTGVITATGATVNFTDSFASSVLSNVTNSGSKVTIGGTVTNTGAVLSVGTGTKLAQLTLGNGGVIEGGTIKDAGAGFVWSYGTLDGVTYDGTLDMSASSSVLHIGPNGLIAKGSGGSGNGTINLTGASSQLQAINNQTLNNVTLSIGSDSGGYAALYDDDTTSTNHTLTLGAGVTINQVGTGALMGDEVGYAGDGFVNDGAINASVSGGAFIINPNSFVNNGTINVSNGDTLTMSATTLTGTGAITATSATVDFTDSFASSILSKVTNSGSKVIIGGTVTNTGAVLSVGTGTKLAQLTLGNGGVIEGGTIKDAGAGFVWNYGTLDGVTYDGTLDMSAASSDLHIGPSGLIAKGSGGSGNGTINLTGASSQLLVVNNQTLNNVAINIGSNSGGYAALYDDDTTSTNHTLTLGAGVTIDQIGTDAIMGDAVGYVGDGFINNGAINAGVSGGFFYIQPSSFINGGSISVSNSDTLTLNATTWSSTGAISVTGATLNLDGAFKSSSLSTVVNSGGTVNIGGTVTNTGAVLMVGTGSKLAKLTLTNNGLIEGGTINDAGAGFVWNGGTLDGVTYNGTVDMSAASSVLRIGPNGLIAKGNGGSGNGTINLTGTNSQLEVVNNQTLNNVTINIGGSSGNYAALYDDDTTSTNHTLTLGAGVTINQVGAGAYLGDLIGYVGDGFVNEGTINAGVSGGRFYIQPSVFNNLGKITVSNGDDLLFAPITLVNYASGVLTGGTFEADAGSTFELTNNTLITTLDATVILSGAGSLLQSDNTTTNMQVTLDSSLTTIGKTGVLQILAGRNWTSTNAMLNQGKLVLGGGSFGPASLTNGGTISGAGAISTTFTNHGFVTVSVGGTLTLANAKFTNQTGTSLNLGTYTVDQNGVLELANNTLITTLNARVIFAGAGSQIESYNTSTKVQVTLDSTLTTITANGTLEVLYGRNWKSTKAIASAGIVMLSGGTFTASSLVSTGTVSGFGVIATSFTNNGSLSITAAKTLSLVGGSLTNLAGTTLTGGAYTVGAGGTLQLANNTSIATLNAALTLNAGSIVQGLNTTTTKQIQLQNSLMAIGATGALKALAGETFTTTNAITSAGLIEAGASGAISIGGAVANTGILESMGGTLTVGGAVSGAGTVVIAGGTASFGSTMNEAVSFMSTGRLVLAKSQSYTAAISGFSLTGGTSLDLRDIGFVSASEATFSGTATGGVLTVSDGTHTAKINLTGNYTTSTFTASSDGQGGVIIVDPVTPPASSVPAFAAAMATITTPASSASSLLTQSAGHSALVLSGPRAFAT